MMTREELNQLERLLERYGIEYADTMSNDRYAACVVMMETVMASIVYGLYKEEDRSK